LPGTNSCHHAKLFKQIESRQLWLQL
jgi:hypothetical protein